MTRRKSPEKTARRRAAVPARYSQQPTAPVAEPGPNRHLAMALDMAPRDSRTLSERSAQSYRTDERNYRAHEVERGSVAARHAQDAGIPIQSGNALTFVESTGFPGFPTLALLAQLPEYRAMHETLADECVRQWGRVKSSGDTPPDILADIEADLAKFDIRAAFRQAVIHDQAFGGGHIYLKLKDDEEFRSTPLVYKRYTVRKDSFQGVRVVEPYWVTPNNYNSIDPTAADFYKPSSWWLLGTETHATRLQTITSRPVPDMLKPTYSFRGVSMSQLAMPYVDNWLRTRQSVSDVLKQFSISGIRTDLQQALLPGGGVDLANRAALINAYRDNRNIMFLDMATEEFFQVNTPLSGLDALQAQSQEQMSAVSHIPMVKLLGVTPTGLNASSEGEIRVFYDYVKGYQTNVLLPVMQNILELIQLSRFGAIDENLFFEWSPLLELTALEAADARAKDADTDTKYLEAGVLTTDQIAEVLNADPHSRYSGVIDERDNMDISELPDDDIAGITAKLLDVNPADAGSLGSGQADVEASPTPGAPVDPLTGAAGESDDVLGDPTLVAPVTLPAPNGIEQNGQTGQPFTNDPSPQVDPGEIPDQVQPEDAALDGWVTAHPNGEGTVGTPLLIGKGGNVIGGAGGKLNTKAKGKGSNAGGGSASGAKSKPGQASKLFSKLMGEAQSVAEAVHKESEK
jgi:uncharacterized protein